MSCKEKGPEIVGGKGNEMSIASEHGHTEKKRTGLDWVRLLQFPVAAVFAATRHNNLACVGKTLCHPFIGKRLHSLYHVVRNRENVLLCMHSNVSSEPYFKYFMKRQHAGE